MKAFETYYEKVTEILEKVKNTQGENLEKAAETLAKTLGSDGLIHAFGTGHSHLVAEEIFYRAGGLAPVNAWLEPSLTGQEQVTKSEYTERMEGWGEILLDYHKPEPRDTLLVISNSGRNAAPIEVAASARNRGIPVIAIISRDHSMNTTSRHSSGKKLLDVADILIDNCGVRGDATFKLPGLKTPIGPTSNISAFFIVHSLVVMAIEKMLEQGLKPPVFLSGNIDEGREHNEELLERYCSRIKNW